MIRFMSDTTYAGVEQEMQHRDFVQEEAEWLSVTFLVV